MNYSPGRLCALAQLVGGVLQIEMSQVQFPVRVRAWVAGLVPSRGKCRMFLSLSFSVPSLTLSLESINEKNNELWIN